MATMIEKLKQIVDVLALGEPDHDKEWLAVKELMLGIPSLKNRWKVYKLLSYLAELTSYHLCNHKTISVVATLPISDWARQREAPMEPIATEVEHCSACDLYRYVWRRKTDKGYGEFEIEVTRSEWEDKDLTKDS